ncbi:gag-polypeptide of LTR copia-type domain-containing protein [Penicillium daleae]|uniref:Gag-polypeptide of LTR copia-type domain-containing protein n=1 Tax=Penicillium daleae TaxID=63821 RepID=A0AAD6C9H0_9EURO|nr:gag-polypeptide of LTR copia-type domain-containing protein [Penicillium daleae]KAJ5454821.1 gag-polypeptide of LTR copia-type domain-containing protein [Penicillium daleae]
MKLVSKLLNTWASDSIKIEIEDCPDAREAYDLIKKRYAVTHERARDNPLNQLNELKLKDYSSVTEYTSKVRQIKADLKTVKYEMTDDMFATALLHGLPPNYRGFKEKYDWIRSTKPDDPPDLDYLYERLHVEEARQLAKDANGNNSIFSATSYNNSQKLKHNDKSHLKCTYPDCGKTGHIEENCWTKNPDKMPRSLKDKFTIDKPINDTDGIGGVAESNLTTPENAYSRANSLDA